MQGVLLQVVVKLAQATAEQDVCSMHLTLHSLQVCMAGGGQLRAQAYIEQSWSDGGQQVCLWWPRAQI